ncbi:MAG: radical SAM family heme chaperone HemW [Limisphaerales bacterium]|nr:MAG: radical SAM family heme chaperone HemW [Limisphaerales bacterium]
MPVQSLYCHVPFCASKCSYCAFFSHAPDRETVDRFVAALVSELTMVADELAPQTIFFGGGTPSILNLRQWETILEAMRRLGLDGAREWTVECNPATVSADKAKLLHEGGVTRISMGVQSLDEALLDRLGRVHSRAMVFKSYDILRNAGFERVNLDLMFAIPSQTMPVWQETLRETIAMQPEHLSCYEVIYEQDTPLYEQLQAGEFDVQEELACDMFEELVRVAGEQGFYQYEVANFGRHQGVGAFDIPDEACLHNVNYWRGGDYHGLGPSATGYVRGVRTTNIRNTEAYCATLENGDRAIDQIEELEPLKRAGEMAAFGLRMNAGWPFEAFEQATGFDLRDEWGETMEMQVNQGHGVVEESGFRLTPQGLRFADAVGTEFLR